MLTNFDRAQHPTAQHTGYYNDPDMLIVGMAGFTAAQNRTHMSLWAISGAPLLAGNNLATMSTETRDILANREVIAIDQDPRGLPGRQGRRGHAPACRCTARSCPAPASAPSCCSTAPPPPRTSPSAGPTWA